MKRIKIFITILITISILVIYGTTYSINHVIIKSYNIENNKIPNNFNNIKIVHFSDIHYNQTIDYKKLKEIVNKINETNPDIVIYTGNLFDKNIKLTEKDITNIIKCFNNIESKLGKYAIKGYMDTPDNWETIMTNSNFINLNDTFDYIYNKDYTPILLTGLSSNKINKTNINDKIKNAYNEVTTYKETNKKDIFSILMMHEPDNIDTIETNKYDLVLAGSSLNRQINVPIINNLFKTEGSIKYYKNYYKINDTKLYISSGLGTNKIKFRLFNNPSINIYTLKNK